MGKPLNWNRAKKPLPFLNSKDEETRMQSDAAQLWLLKNEKPDQQPQPQSAILYRMEQLRGGIPVTIGRLYKPQPDNGKLPWQ